VPGSYTVTYAITAGACGTITASTNVIITSAPTASISYPGAPFCNSLTAPQSVTLTGSGGGTYSVTPAGITINLSNGAITPSTSIAGNYTITYTIPAAAGCSEVTASTNVTITELPIATFSYTASPYCQNASNPTPTFSGGGVAGIFSSGAGLVFVNIATGQVDLSASTAGIYTVTNTIAAMGGCTLVTATAFITITVRPTATINYAGSPYCTSINTAQPVILAGTGAYTGGTFTSTSGLTLNSTTGAVTPGSSAAGTYIVTYTIPASGGCDTISSSTSVTITALPIATFSYTGSPYCSNAADPYPTLNAGGSAGVFSSASGLVFISNSTGQVDITASTPGTYIITNTISSAGGCSVITATSSITINTLPTASISYSGSPYYKSESTQSVIFSGTAGGTYSASPAGLTINAASGLITPATSTAGSYTVTYTIAASGGCAIVTATASIVILAGDIITVAGSNGADGDYPSLTNATGAFIAINAQNQTGKTITVTIKKNSKSEAGTNSLNAGAWTSLTLYPTTPGITISGSVAGPLINLNGADNVTIDGRVGAAGSSNDLIISNTNTGTSASTIQFINTAESNTVKYCFIKGAATSATKGIILFSTATALRGNNSNTIDHNYITSDAAGRPVNAIYSAGTSGLVNTANTISNNTIYDIWRTASSSFAIQIFTFSSDFSISGNSIYETTTIIPTMASSVYSGIYINNAAGNNFTVTGNYIGGQAALCGGSPLTVNAAVTHVFHGIYLNVGATTASSVQNNMIQNFNYTSSNTAPWQAINIIAGAVNVGTVTGNTIGSATGTGSVTINATANSTNIYGITITSAGTIDCQNNTIGSIIAANGTASNATNFYGINKTVVAGTTTISYNTIGSLTTANSIQASSTSTGTIQNVVGISFAGTGTAIINNNTIANLLNSTNNATAATAGVINGIRSTSASGANTVSNNIIHDLSIANRNTTATNTASVCGIALSGATARTISGNVIYNLSNSYPAFAGNISGLYFTGSTGTNVVSGNFIHDLSVTGTSPGTASIYGIKIAAGNTTYSNNIIDLGGNTAATLYGIYETGAANNNNNLYFNTVYIWGSLASGIIYKSYALYSAVTTNTRNFRNNLLTNVRSTSGGTNLHFAAYFNYTANTNLTVDYNDYYVTGTGGVLGFYNNANKTTLPIVTGKDASSISTNPAFGTISGSNPTDYKVNVSLPGISGTGITLDFGSILRGIPPTIGAWERMVINKWKGTISNAWNIAGNWTDNTVPATDANIVFDDVPVNHCQLDQNRSVTNITNAQSTYRMVINGFKLTIKGDLIFTNGAQIDASTINSTAEFAGSLAQSIPAGTFYNDAVYNLTVNNALNVALNGNLRLLNSITANTGHLDAFTNSSTFSYSGTALQTIASQFLNDKLNNLTVDNIAGVALANNITINGILSLSNGAFSPGSMTLTFQNSDTPITRSAGTLTTTANTNLVFGTAGNTNGAAFTIPSGTFTSDPLLNNLTINRTNSLSLNNQMMSLRGVLLCTNGTLNTGGKLTLLSTAAQTALIDGSGAGNVLGNVTMQRYLPSAFGYKYFSSPFQAATVNEFADEVDLSASFPTFYSYNEDNHRDSLGIAIYSTGWTRYIVPTNVLLPMNGYAANFGISIPAKTVNITGEVSNNILTTQTLYNHDRIYTHGFNLAGNPYPSPIDWNATSGWTKTNIDNALYFFDAGSSNQYTGTYSTYINGVSSNGIANNIIPSLQGFFVHVTNGQFPVTASFGMDNRVRINNLSTSFHKSSYDERHPIIRLTAIYENEKMADPAVVYFNDFATSGFDQMFDALKLMNTDISVPNLYALTPKEEKLSISGIPYPADSITKSPLGLITEQSGWIYLTALDIKDISSGLRVYLSDNKTGLIQDLQQNPVYHVYLDKGTSDNRFALLFSTKDLVHIPREKDTFFADIENGKLNIFVELARGNEARLSVSNMLGQILFQNDHLGDGAHQFDYHFPAGIYILTLYSQQGAHSQKLYIPN
ncbi:MAG: T9SS type A sorting domain-containing protein, partial [Bacteroidota bacterium]